MERFADRIGRATIRVAAMCAALALVAGGAAAGPKAYVGNFRDDSVSVVDVDAGRVVATVPVAHGPHGMTAAGDGRRVYVAGDASSQVDVIDVATDRVVRSIEVGRRPHGLATTPDGRFVLAAVYGEDRIAVIATADDRVVATVPVAKPHTIAVAPDGRTAYVSSQEPGAFALVFADLASRAVVRRVALPKPPRDLEFASDGHALYFTEAGVDAVQVLDPRDDHIVAEIPTGASPHIAAAYRGAPAGTIVVQGPGELQLFDPATNRPTRTIPVGRQPHWIAWAGPQARVVVTNEGSNDLAIVDLATGATTHVAVGTAPRKVVVVAGGPATASGGSAASDPASAAAPPAPPASNVADAAARVAIAGFAFGPGEVRVAQGQRVTWTNTDGAPHGLAFGDGAAGSNPLLPGESFSRVYAAAGTFDYDCPIHPFMHGRVIVTSR